MRLWTLQLAILACVVIAGLIVSAIGAPLKLKTMCAQIDPGTDPIGRQLCSDLAAGRR